MSSWILLFTVTAASGQDGAPAPKCFPPCSPGYLCHQGACIEACNPPCGEGFRCSAERVCEAVAPPPAPAPAAASAPAPAAPTQDPGEATLCIVRQPGPMTKWDIDVDGISHGIVGSNRHVCFPVSAGDHVVRLTQVAGGMGWAQAMSKAPVVQLAPDVTSAVPVTDGDKVALLCDAQIKFASVHLSCETVRGVHQVDALLTRHKPEKTR